uniref:Uncharacterized protein n=1 Tax=Myoviridae sp. ctsip2 TaxID=2826705 RepID=A0A8S5N6J6_9CAUD|nr:MAG TPA: hypothetical protein [Myoviridae sp. ctsip2]
MSKNAKPIHWNKIKAEYLQGAFPRELAKKFGITAKQISDKANSEKWVQQKAQISEKVRENVEEKISRITNLALDRLEEILEGSILRPDFVSAIGKAIDISGLKTAKQEITGIDGSPIIQKVFVTPEEVKEVDKHIEGVINERG